MPKLICGTCRATWRGSWGERCPSCGSGLIDKVPLIRLPIRQVLYLGYIVGMLAAIYFVVQLFPGPWKEGLDKLPEMVGDAVDEHLGEDDGNEKATDEPAPEPAKKPKPRRRRVGYRDTGPGWTAPDAPPTGAVDGGRTAPPKEAPAEPPPAPVTATERPRPSGPHPSVAGLGGAFLADGETYMIRGQVENEGTEAVTELEVIIILHVITANGAEREIEVEATCRDTVVEPGGKVKFTAMYSAPETKAISSLEARVDFDGN